MRTLAVSFSLLAIVVFSRTAAWADPHQPHQPHQPSSPHQRGCCVIGPGTCDEISANDCAQQGGQLQLHRRCDFATGSCERPHPRHVSRPPEGPAVCALPGSPSPASDGGGGGVPAGSQCACRTLVPCPAGSGPGCLPPRQMGATCPGGLCLPPIGNPFGVCGCRPPLPCTTANCGGCEGKRVNSRLNSCRSTAWFWGSNALCAAW